MKLLIFFGKGLESLLVIGIGHGRGGVEGKRRAEVEPLGSGAEGRAELNCGAKKRVRIFCLRIKRTRLLCF